MTIWIRFVYDIGPIVTGIYKTEIEARRTVDTFEHVMVVSLPCEDVLKAITERMK